MTKDEVLDTLETMLQDGEDADHISNEDLMCAIVGIELGHEIPKNIAEAVFRRTLH